MHETYDSEPLMRGEFLYYLYSFAVLGTGFRMFMARFFGHDCEHPGSVTDFMSPLSEKICVTSNGMTLQHGGALFSGKSFGWLTMFSGVKILWLYYDGLGTDPFVLLIVLHLDRITGQYAG